MYKYILIRNLLRTELIGDCLISLHCLILLPLPHPLFHLPSYLPTDLPPQKSGLKNRNAWGRWGLPSPKGDQKVTKR